MTTQHEFQVKNSFNDLIQYYDVRMKALSDFSTRVWNRFNWFLTLHLGAFAFVFSNLVKAEESSWYSVVTIIVALTAVVWTILGYEDFKHMQKYDSECKEIEKAFLSNLEQRESITFQFIKNASNQRGFLPFKHSRVLHLFPMTVFVIWVGLAVYLSV